MALTNNGATKHVRDGPQDIDVGHSPFASPAAIVEANVAPTAPIHDQWHEQNGFDP
jgi:hypothetical protein